MADYPDESKEKEPRKRGFIGMVQLPKPLTPVKQPNTKSKPKKKYYGRIFQYKYFR